MTEFFRKYALPLSIVIASIAIALLVWWGLCIWQEIHECSITSKAYCDWVTHSGDFAAVIITTLLLIAAGLLAGSQLVVLRRSGYAQLLLHIEEQWDSPHFMDMRYAVDRERHSILQKLRNNNLGDIELQKILLKKFGEKVQSFDENSKKEYFTFTGIIDFWETFAYLIRKKNIPMEDVKETFGALMVNYYDMFSYYIENVARKQSGNSKAYEQLEHIVKELRPTYQKRPQSKNT